MDARVDDSLKDPLYQQIFDVLRAEILAGTYDHDRELPSDKQLEERFGVSRITIRRAIEELARGGLVDRAKGRATRVTERPMPIFVDVDDELNNMLAVISNLKIKVINFRWIPADTFVAARLRIETGEKLLWITRIRSGDNGPVMHSSLYLPRWAGEGFTREDLAQNPIVELLRRRGVELVSAEQTLSAAACPDGIAARLNLEPGAPIFFIRRVIHDNHGRPAMFTDVSFRWDCFTYHMSLEPRSPKRFASMLLQQTTDLQPS
jgi:GntR family transcriptional regulator